MVSLLHRYIYAIVFFADLQIIYLLPKWSPYARMAHFPTIPFSAIIVIIYTELRLLFSEYIALGTLLKPPVRMSPDPADLANTSNPLREVR